MFSPFRASNEIIWKWEMLLKIPTSEMVYPKVKKPVQKPRAVKFLRIGSHNIKR